MRLARPDLTDTPEWFLKHSLATHPKFAESKTKEETMKLRAHDRIPNLFYKRSLLGNSEYLTRYEDERRRRELEEAANRKNQQCK